MLAGRYPSDEFAELRPRIVWDRVTGVVRGRTGARRLAVTNAGTIPDRGLYGVFQVEGGGRVGELDEEMVYEAREGQTFMLGASTWRIEEITRDRVLVSPAPGVPGAVPFWKGEGVGRPYELGARSARRRASWSLSPTRERPSVLRDDYHLDALAARNLLDFLREQERTGAVPSDRTVVVERFRDEIGDWRVCVLTPFGGRVHAPWSMALAARIRDALGLEVQSLWSDDGIALHLPDADAPPAVADLLVDPDELEDLVVQEVGQTALFGARFRENAARALLIPRRRPGQRTPLWQQRLKAQSLLAGGAALRLVPDRARDVPRVPAGRLRPAGAARRPPGPPLARARPRRGRDARPPRRWPRRCCSTTSRPTCTRTTRPRPSGGRRRSRSTASCCASCSAPRSCASCSTPTRSRRSRRRCCRGRGTPTSCTTSSAAPPVCSRARSTPASPRRSSASAAHFAPVWAASTR